MAVCEKCGKQHDGTFGSGRFCSRKCANTHTLTDDTRQKIQKSLCQFYSSSKGSTMKKYLSECAKKQGANITSVRVAWHCPVCGKELMLIQSDARKRQYCSGKCRNKILNRSNNNTRSKAEKVMQREMQRLLPDLPVVYNDRETLQGLELDVFFPTLNLAIEWNGIYHYKDVHNTLHKIQTKDKLKKELCDKLGITLIVIKDTTSSATFIRKHVSILCKMLLRKEKINEG